VAGVCKQGNGAYCNTNHKMHAVLLILQNYLKEWRLDTSGSGQGQVAAVCKHGNGACCNTNHKIEAVLLILQHYLK
jgi:hypothetical protein